MGPTRAREPRHIGDALRSRESHPGGGRGEGGGAVRARRGGGGGGGGRRGGRRRRRRSAGCEEGEDDGRGRRRRRASRGGRLGGASRGEEAGFTRGVRSEDRAVAWARKRAGGATSKREVNLQNAPATKRANLRARRRCDSAERASFPVVERIRPKLLRHSRAHTGRRPCPLAPPFLTSRAARAPPRRGSRAVTCPAAAPSRKRSVRPLPARTDFGLFTLISPPSSRLRLPPMRRRVADPSRSPPRTRPNLLPPQPR